jgi:hypothetical protein
MKHLAKSVRRYAGIQSSVVNERIIGVNGRVQHLNAAAFVGRAQQTKDQPLSLQVYRSPAAGNAIFATF